MEARVVGSIAKPERKIRSVQVLTTIARIVSAPLIGGEGRSTFTAVVGATMIVSSINDVV